MKNYHSVDAQVTVQCTKMNKLHILSFLSCYKHVRYKDRARHAIIKFNFTQILNAKLAIEICQHLKLVKET